ncbi:GDSL-type esterase/lipase family protein [Neobacillus niacini]|uniref:GDSL-type esterase/lipase family protein n=1 Tax=Neobacillus niacini TaxID=86668 RepID=UPI0021CB4BF6|nr:GDSL-type esterase/lipase family protein [Neobacillus niacini]MCM3764442.1 GDSL-type esterase/lipase family protein [Neobacillus niacini]
MKVLKYLIVSVAVIGLGMASWFYYPYYQIHKLKKQTVQSASAKVSYIDFFRDTKAAQINHLALGDSVIRGFGAGQNENLVTQFSEKLGQQINKPIYIQNEGINGLTSGELNELVQAGKFDEAIRHADIITINIGGNDILHAADKRDLTTVIQSFHQLQDHFSKNLTDISAKINRINPGATIVLLEQYNPIPPTDSLYTLADQLLPKWNLIIYETANQLASSIVVETTKVINRDNLDNLSTDRIHPSPKGYAAISEQMIYQLRHQYRKT